MAVVMVKTWTSLRSVLCVCVGAMQCINSLAQNGLWNIFRLRVREERNPNCPRQSRLRETIPAAGSFVSAQVLGNYALVLRTVTRHGGESSGGEAAWPHREEPSGPAGWHT
jgi:hypothetical protein